MKSVKNAGSTQVRLLSSDEDLEPVCDVLLELRPQYDVASMTQQIRKQQLAGYQLAVVTRQEQIFAVAGFVICEKLAWRKHLYVDDLVTRAGDRSTGAGHRLMAWLRKYAREQGCEQIHLDSGVQRFGAHRFYLREGFDITSHHFSLLDLCAAP